MLGTSRHLSALRAQRRLLRIIRRTGKSANSARLWPRKTEVDCRKLVARAGKRDANTDITAATPSIVEACRDLQARGLPVQPASVLERRAAVLLAAQAS